MVNNTVIAAPAIRISLSFSVRAGKPNPTLELYNYRSCTNLEAGGIEPPSEDAKLKLSTRVAKYYAFGGAMPKPKEVLDVPDFPSPSRIASEPSYSVGAHPNKEGDLRNSRHLCSCLRVYELADILGAQL